MKIGDCFVDQKNYTFKAFQFIYCIIDGRYGIIESKKGMVKEYFLRDVMGKILPYYVGNSEEVERHVTISMLSEDNAWLMLAFPRLQEIAGELIEQSIASE
jgi:hypothetical protein